MALFGSAAAVESAELSVANPEPAARPRRSLRHALVWLGVAPIVAYLAIFLLIPTGELVVDAFKGTNGQFTLSNVDAIIHGQYLAAFQASVEVAGLSALMGGVLGFFVVNAVLHRGAPRFLRPAIVTFSGMAANFAGVPLAFAFTSTLGATGVITQLASHFGVNLNTALPLSGVLGLAVVYTYFQFPLMVLLVVPAVDGLKREWREAAENLGASSFNYWRYIGFPILVPALLGAVVLLFGSAFAAYATAEAISGSTGNLVTELIANLTNGNITVDPQLAYALAFGMIVIITITVTAYSLLQRRASRWLR
ncbi:MAG: ABC transporter permease [Acidimicrobiales bacterium]